MLLPLRTRPLGAKDHDHVIRKTSLEQIPDVATFYCRGA